MDTLAAYGSLFLSALVAATMFPIQSEAVLAGLLLTESYSPFALFAVATVGNVLGSVINWWLGLQVNRFRGRRWFPVSERALDRATALYQRWGVWSLLLAWTPFLGDPLTVAAGVLRTPLALFIALVTAGKAARYALIVWALV